MLVKRASPFSSRLAATLIPAGWSGCFPSVALHLASSPLLMAAPRLTSIGVSLRTEQAKECQHGSYSGRVPHVRPSVRGPKKTGEALQSFWSLVPATDRWVPHISLVFREMWDTTNLNIRRQ